jgi:predicted phosphodiesterase
MLDPLKKILEPIQELQNIRGIDLPIGLEFLQLVVTGPPGAGKSYYIEQIRGWPNEGYLDLSQKGWWKNQSLVFRPREVHLGIPFVGIKEALTVFDNEYLKLANPPEIDFGRIRIPPLKQYFYQTDYRSRYIFEFLIPNANTIFEQRQARQSKGYFPVDESLTLEMVRQQISVYREIALYFHRAGLNVYIRKGLDKPPMRIAEKGIANVPRWAISAKPAPPRLTSWAGLTYFFRKKSLSHWIILTNEPQQLLESGRIAHDGRSFQLQLGSTQLKCQPEIPIGVKRKAAQKNWTISGVEGCGTRGINGFMRIKPGETMIIGRGIKEQNELFLFADDVSERHLSIANRRGDLILTPLTEQGITKVLRIDDHDYREQMERGRIKTLKEIRNLYGQVIEMLPSHTALSLLQQVNELLAKEPFRPKNDAGLPGGLVELPSYMTPVIIGDLHAQVDNLLKILTENCLLESLRKKSATLIFLGDAVHSENINELESFESSLLMMDIILRLKLRFPENCFYLRGNHDSFATTINKNGVLQGVLFREAMCRLRGDIYTEEMEKFYHQLPLILQGDMLLACHAGPPRTEVTREQIINITNYPELANELTTNRLQRPNYLAGYAKRDVKRLRKSFNLPSPKTRLIVGHTPMDPFGSFWLHAGAIKNHHVIYSAHAQGPSIFIKVGESFMPITYPAEPLTEIINKLR